MKTDKTKITVTQKEPFKLPKGAEIVEKRVTTRVEQIENGYLIISEIELEYKTKEKDYTQHKYLTKKLYSATNPIEINVEDKDKKYLADILGNE